VTAVRRPWLYFGPAALAAGGLAVALTITSDHEEHPALATALGLFVSWSFILAGLIGWTRRPQNRTGMLMVGVGFGVLVASLAEANEPLPYTLGTIFGSVFIAAFVHLLLAYPAGNLISRYALTLVGAGYATSVLAPLFNEMFPGHREPCKPHACPDNLVQVSSDHSAHVAQTVFWTSVAVLLFAAAFWLLVGRWRRATPTLRRILRPVYIAGALSLFLFTVANIISPFSGTVSTVVAIALIATFTAVPFLFLAGLLGTRLARSAGMDTVLGAIPERASPAEVQAGLQVALRDPTAVVAYWYEEGGHYVDVEGNRFELPSDTRRRVVTRLEYSDTPVAAIVHDAALREEPELLEAIASAARIALERDKLLVEVRARAERYRGLLQAMPDLMFRISRDGRYLSYNAPTERDLYSMDVVGLSLWDRLPHDLAERILWAGRLAIASGKSQVLEYELDFDGDTRHYEGRFASSGDDEFLMIVREISERKRQQEELQSERDFLSMIANATPSLLCAIDSEGRITERGVNFAFADVLGYDDEAARGRSLAELIFPEEDRAKACDAMTKPRPGDTSVWYEGEWVSRDGRRIPVSWSSRPLAGVYSTWYLICGIDVSERKRQQSELEASRARIVAAGDEARRRLERNLHDGAQQRLVSLSLALRLIQTRLERDPQGAEALMEAAREELAQALEELRELARGIHPAVLTDRGLEAALEALAARAPLPVVIEPPAAALPPPVEAAAYYVVSEALANVTKYAEAASVTVRVAADNGYALVEVTDDGVGGADPVRGSGLSGLADRVASLDGRLEVESPPGVGTRVRAEIPLK
jgi:PAS domain S-box-containing protein